MSTESLLPLGISSATPTRTRHPSAYMLRMRNRLFLLDCGEGTQMQMLLYNVKASRIERIFISHLHPDHYLGLLGLLTTLNLQGRTKALHIYGPPALEQIIRMQFEVTYTEFRYALHFHALNFNESQVIFEDEKLMVKSIPVQHRIECWGFFFKEKERELNIRQERVPEIPVRAFGILKRGERYTDETGKVFTPEAYCMPPEPPKTFAYITDTVYLPKLKKELEGVDFLFHEATFMHDQEEKAVGFFHATTVQAATLARNAGAGKLMIGHFSSRYDNLKPLLAEAQSVFPNTILAEEGKEVWF